MFSSKKAARNKRKDARNTTTRGRPAQEEQAPFREEEMLLFDYGVHGPELMAGNACSGFAPRDLDRLGPQHQATQFPGRTTSRPGDFTCFPNSFPTTSQLPFPAANATYPGPQPGVTPVNPVAVNWQLNNALYANDDSPAVSTGPNANVFGYESQQSTPSQYTNDYVSPTALQHAPQPGFEVYPWPGAGNDTVSLGTPNPGIPNFAGTPEGTFSDSDPVMYAEEEDWQQHHHQYATHRIKTEPEPEPEPEPKPPQHKRTKNSPNEQSTSPPSSSRIPTHPPQTTPSPAPPADNNTTNNSSSSKSTLRSASRASKNTQYHPAETPRERKSRNSHNLVEKQYRNRLNTQFEILMNTLPASMRSPAGTAAGVGVGMGMGMGASASGGDSDGPGPGSGLESTGGRGAGRGRGSSSAAHHGAFETVGGERRLSKAQVLDMSARYIRSLEQERDRLVEEKEVLMEDVRRLRGDG